MRAMGKMNATVLVPLIFARSVLGGPEDNTNKTSFTIRYVTAALRRRMNNIDLKKHS